MNYLLLMTGGGRKYAKRISIKIKEQQRNSRVYLYRCWSLDLAFSNHPEWNNRNLIIHSRAANPNMSWMRRLFELEEQGYRIVNKPEVLTLTSDKWESIRSLQTIGNIPYTVCRRKNTFQLTDLSPIQTDSFIIKPRYSQGQGESVHKFRLNQGHQLSEFLRTYPSNQFLIQEYIPYLSIYRVFVINGRAMSIVTKDVPNYNRWKVSVCLNPRQTVIRNPDPALLRFAERIQQEIGGEINFIDVFETNAGYVLSEINTACNLKIHERLSGYSIARRIANYLISCGE